MRWTRQRVRRDRWARRKPLARLVLSPVRRRRSKFAFERPVECRLRFVADLLRHRGERLAAVQEFLRRDLQPPAGQILHGRLSEQVGESLRQRGTRQSPPFARVHRRSTRARVAREASITHGRRTGRAHPRAILCDPQAGYRYNDGPLQRTATRTVQPERSHCRRAIRSLGGRELQ